jgi:hypothetical protein
MRTTAVDPQRSLDTYLMCPKGSAMQDVNTNPSSTPSATLRAQHVTDAVIAAYIQEISDGQPVRNSQPSRPRG